MTYGLRSLSSLWLHPVSLSLIRIALLSCFDRADSFCLVVCLVSEKTEHHLGINNQLLTVLGTVLGLVISFRTSSAYERYC